MRAERAPVRTAPEGGAALPGVPPILREARRDPEVLRRQARERLQEALRQRGDRRWLRPVTLPAPLGPVDALLRAEAGPLRALRSDGLHAVLWHPPGGAARCGIGAAWEARLDGADRIVQLRAQVSVLHPRVLPDGAEGAPTPRIFGGLAFAPGWHGAASWRAFGDGRFFLPRWCYRRSGEDAFLQVLLRGDGARGDEALAELEAALDAIEAPAPPAAPPAPETVEQLDPAAWREQVDAILAAIGRRECEKVVAARRCLLTARAPIEDAPVLRRLIEEQAACTIFALRCGPASFVGATPERLVSRRGTEVRTEALAGTRRRSEEAALSRSGKDRAEHDLVVRDILHRLRPFCAPLSTPPPPAPRLLRDVLHLHTPISGRLRGPVHVLDLVQALHPTPAVAGAPAGAATRWIVTHEPEPRGWYAGPVGWFDARGDGEFAVALRSALLEGSRAHVYAGAGIVVGSDAAGEYEETALKQRALLSALGAQP